MSSNFGITHASISVGAISSEKLRLCEELLSSLLMLTHMSIEIWSDSNLRQLSGIEDIVDTIPTTLRIFIICLHDVGYMSGMPQADDPRVVFICLSDKFPRYRDQDTFERNRVTYASGVGANFYWQDVNHEKDDIWTLAELVLKERTARMLEDGGKCRVVILVLVLVHTPPGSAASLASGMTNVTIQNEASSV